MGTVIFCPECETLLRKKRNKDGNIIYFCKCGYETITEEANRKTSLTDEERKRKGMATKTLILETMNVIENPTTDVVCPKCEHTKAEYFQYQTRSADEPATTFYRCLKCDNKWRQY